MGVVELYRSIIDEEFKVRTRTPFVSKFRNAEFDVNDDHRLELFIAHLKGKELSRPNIMEAFYVSTFKAWKKFNRSGKEKCYVGYSPIIGVDGDKIIEDYKGNGVVLHIMRNPFSAYGDTSKRPVPHNIAHYMTGWTLNQYYARYYAEKYPRNFFILRFEDIIKNPKKVLGGFLEKIGLDPDSDTLKYPSWNGNKMKEVYPWGTIKIPTEEVNIKTAKELTKAQIGEIYDRTKQYIEICDYKDIYAKVK
jgi:hypothetical protein